MGRQLGLLMAVLSLTLLALGLGSLVPWWPMAAQRRSAGLALLLTAAIGLTTSGGLWLVGSRLWGRWRGEAGQDDFLGRREALLLVALSWLLGAVLAALPYWIWARTADNIPRTHPFWDFVNCYFEAISGLTTTGATILVQVEPIPDALLLWRATTHWFGGLGIVVLFVAVLPTLGVGGKRLFQIESPGPRPQRGGGIKPRIRQTARALWLIYLALTILGTLSLRLIGQMGWFDAVCHTFSMVSTGGLSTRTVGIAYYDSAAVDMVCSVFMLLAGVNFAIFYYAVQGRWAMVWRDSELRVYLVLKITVLVVVSLSLIGWPMVTTAGKDIPGTVGQAFRFGTFQAVSLHTGTGYATADYDSWPYISRVLLVGLMFVGGCAGSTAGGVKVIRFWIGLRVMAGQLDRMFRPNVVRPLRLGRTILDQETSSAAITYFLAMLLMFAAGAALLGLFEAEIDLVTSLTASISMLCNVGPGLGGVGATQNYHWFSDASKWVLSLLMLLGRLEIFTILVLAAPRFWRSD